MRTLASHFARTPRFFSALQVLDAQLRAKLREPVAVFHAGAYGYYVMFQQIVDFGWIDLRRCQSRCS